MATTWVWIATIVRSYKNSDAVISFAMLSFELLYQFPSCLKQTRPESSRWHAREISAAVRSARRLLRTGRSRQGCAVAKKWSTITSFITRALWSGSRKRKRALRAGTSFRASRCACLDGKWERQFASLRRRSDRTRSVACKSNTSWSVECSRETFVVQLRWVFSC